MGKCRAATVVGLLLTVAACTSDPRPSPAQSATSPESSASSAIADVSCADAVDPAAELPAGYRLVGGVVGVPTQRTLQAFPSGERDAAAKLFAKWGLVVRAGVTVEIAVGAGWGRKAQVGWGNPGRPASSVRVQACPAAGGSGAWTAFVGGTWVRAPACVPLTVQANGRTERIQLPIGAPCP